jgi:hypothetical protein
LSSPGKGSAKARAQVTKEYALTLDGGKHIAILSGTDRGFEVREHFLECEKRASDPRAILLAPIRPELMEMAAGAARDRDIFAAQVVVQQATIAMLEPKCELFDAVAVSASQEETHGGLR